MNDQNWPFQHYHLQEASLQYRIPSNNTGNDTSVTSKILHLRNNTWPTNEIASTSQRTLGQQATQEGADSCAEHTPAVQQVRPADNIRTTAHPHDGETTDTHPSPREEPEWTRIRLRRKEAQSEQGLRRDI